MDQSTKPAQDKILRHNFVKVVMGVFDSLLSFIWACYGSLVASQLRIVLILLRVHLHSESIGSLACNELTLG